jgi:hypothetical protein
MEELFDHVNELKNTIESLTPVQRLLIPPSIFSNVSYLLESMDKISSSGYQLYLFDEIVFLNTLIKIAKTTTHLLFMSTREFHLN